MSRTIVSGRVAATGKEAKRTANNSIVWHLLKVPANQDVATAGGGDKDLTNRGSLFHGGHLIASHSSLQGIDRVDLGNKNASTHAAQSHGAALTDIAEASNDGNLASNHDIGGALDAINQRLAAAVEIVELGLGDGVVHVDSRDQKLAFFVHAVKMVNASSSLLRQAIAVLEHIRVLSVHQMGEIATIIQDEVQLFAVLKSKELLLQTPVVFLLGLALPGENGNARGGNSGSSVVLGAEYVARRPSDLGTESDQRLDQNGGLNGHVQAASDTSALEWLVGSILLADGHEAGHFVLSQLNLLAPKGSKREVSDLELVSGGRHSGEREAAFWDKQAFRSVSRRERQKRDKMGRKISDVGGTHIRLLKRGCVGGARGCKNLACWDSQDPGSRSRGQDRHNA